MSKSRVTSHEFRKALAGFGSDKIGVKNDYYFLKGRKKIVSLRQKREKISLKKMQVARRTAKYLKLIPWVKMVGVTGALAMNNSDQDDDIDLLIVASRNRLWLTRLFSVLLVEVVAKRRRPGDKEVSDKICLNMFLDENHLDVLPRKKNLYTAHEVVQLRLIWDRNEVYQKFMDKNQWVADFLPNAFLKNQKSKITRSRSGKAGKSFLFWVLIFNLLEKFVMNLQFCYMAGRKTTEVTEPSRILFHPQDCQNWILKKYRARIRKFGFKVIEYS